MWIGWLCLALFLIFNGFSVLVPALAIPPAFLALFSIVAGIALILAMCWDRYVVVRNP